MNSKDLPQDAPWVLVTGGARGIGRSTVEYLCHRGYEVVFTYSTSQEQAAALSESQTRVGLRCTAVKCDGRNKAHVKEAVAGLLAQKGAPYALINNMGICRDATILRMNDDEWESVIETNLGSAFSFTQQVARSMIARRDGVIIQISSVAGIKGVVGQTNYSASKAGLIGFTRSLALELARFNIRVNAIAPGFIDTDMLSQLSSDRRSSLASSIPLRRIGSVADVTGLVDFLLSDKASYIIGQTLVVDGGLTV